MEGEGDNKEKPDRTRRATSDAAARTGRLRTCALVSARTPVPTRGGACGRASDARGSADALGNAALRRKSWEADDLRGFESSTAESRRRAFNDQTKADEASAGEAYTSTRGRPLGATRLPPR